MFWKQSTCKAHVRFQKPNAHEANLFIRANFFINLFITSFDVTKVKKGAFVTSGNEI